MKVEHFAPLCCPGPGPDRRPPSHRRPQSKVSPEMGRRRRLSQRASRGARPLASRSRDDRGARRARDRRRRARSVPSSRTRRTSNSSSLVSRPRGSILWTSSSRPTAPSSRTSSSRDDAPPSSNSFRDTFTCAGLGVPEAATSALPSVLPSTHLSPRGPGPTSP